MFLTDDIKAKIKTNIQYFIIRFTVDYVLCVWNICMTLQKLYSLVHFDNKRYVFKRQFCLGHIIKWTNDYRVDKLCDWQLSNWYMRIYFFRYILIKSFKCHNFISTRVEWINITPVAFYMAYSENGITNKQIPVTYYRWSLRQMAECSPYWTKGRSKSLVACPLYHFPNWLNIMKYIR
jgi:hypothetical protein